MFRLTALVLLVFNLKSQGFRFSAQKKREMQKKKLATLAKREKAPTKSPALNKQRQVEVAGGREAVNRQSRDEVDKYDTSAEEASMRRRIEADGEKFGWSKERIQNSANNKIKDIRSRAAQRKLNDRLDAKVKERERARGTSSPPTSQATGTSEASNSPGELPEITSGSEKQNKFAQDVRARYVKTLDGIYKMWKINPQLPDQYKNHSFDQFLDTIAGGKALKKLISEKDAKFWIDTVRGRENSMAQIQDLLKNEKFRQRYGGSNGNGVTNSGGNGGPDKEVEDRIWERQNPEDFIGKPYVGKQEQDAIREDPSKADALIKVANSIIERQDGPRGRRQSEEIRERNRDEMREKIRSIKAFRRSLSQPQSEREDRKNPDARATGQASPKPQSNSQSIPSESDMKKSYGGLLKAMKNNSGLQRGQAKQAKEWAAGSNPALKARGNYLLREMRKLGYTEAG